MADPYKFAEWTTDKLVKAASIADMPSLASLSAFPPEIGEATRLTMATQIAQSFARVGIKGDPADNAAAFLEHLATEYNGAPILLIARFLKTLENGHFELYGHEYDRVGGAFADFAQKFAQNVEAYKHTEEANRARVQYQARREAQGREALGLPPEPPKALPPPVSEAERQAATEAALREIDLFAEAKRAATAQKRAAKHPAAKLTPAEAWAALSDLAQEIAKAAFQYKEPIKATAISVAERFKTDVISAADACDELSRAGFAWREKWVNGHGLNGGWLYAFNLPEHLAKLNEVLIVMAMDGTGE